MKKGEGLLGESALDSVSANYYLFLAVDATSINDEALRKTGKSLLERGIAYFCVWGNSGTVLGEFLQRHKTIIEVTPHLDVSGYYYASPTVVRGFVRQADGTFTTFDAVGSTWTEPESINDAGEITGYYLADLGLGLVPHGFLRYADGHIITFGPPCVNVCNTSQPVSIGSFGDAAGT